MGIFGLPINAIKTLVKSMNINYTCSLNKLYVVNPTSVINFLWKMVSCNIFKFFILLFIAFLDDNTRNKVFII